MRAAAILWAAWLFFTWCFFASSNFINSYYLAALAPPIAALCGLGLTVAWRLRARRATRAVILGTVAAGTAYVLYLLPAGAGVRPWVEASTLALALAAVAVTAWSLLPARPAWATGAGVALSAAALFVGSAWASATVVTAGLGPFDSAYQPAALTAQEHAADARSAAVSAGLNRDAARVAPSVSVVTNETSAASSVPIVDTGREFLPVGGFTGRVPSPTRGPVRRLRPQRPGHAGAGRSGAAHPQPGHALGHRALPSPHDRGPDDVIGGRSMRFFLCSPADAGG